VRALTIAYRGNFQPGVARPWSTETHVAEALESLGHQVVRLQENQAGWADCETAGRAADVFLWQRTWDIDPAGGHRTLAALGGAGVPTVSFHLDLYIGLERESQLATDPFWRTDLVVTADGGHDDQFKAYGINHHWLPPAVAESECVLGRPTPRRYPHRIVFVGSHPYPHPAWRPYRDRLLVALKARYRKDFRIWPDRGRPIRGRDLADLYASAAVVVGDSCLAGQVPRYWSDRTPETLGRGGFLMHPEVEGMGAWYRPGVDFVTYPVGDIDALCGHIDHYLDAPDQRAQIAAQGRATVLGRDTYRHRMATVLATVEAELGFPTRRAPAPADA
jgi:hypothetical protein